MFSLCRSYLFLQNLTTTAKLTVKTWKVFCSKTNPKSPIHLKRYHIATVYHKARRQFLRSCQILTYSTPCGQFVRGALRHAPVRTEVNVVRSDLRWRHRPERETPPVEAGLMTSTLRSGDASAVPRTVLLPGIRLNQRSPVAI